MISRIVCCSVVVVEVILLCLFLIPLCFQFRRRFDAQPPRPPLRVWPSALFVGVCTGKLAAFGSRRRRALRVRQ